LKIGMIEVIAREFVAVTWLRGFVLRGGGPEAEKKRGAKQGATLHGPLPGD